MRLPEQPVGYECIHRDEKICRGPVFYTPGSASAATIDAAQVTPVFLVYRRLAPTAGPRDCYCLHVRKHHTCRNTEKKNMHFNMLRARLASQQQLKQNLLPMPGELLSGHP